MNHESHETPNYDCQACAAEMAASNREEYLMMHRGEREMRQAMRLAREDLDMGLDVDEPELMAAIQRRFKR